MSFKYKCPLCHQHYEADEPYEEKMFTCVSCNKRVQLSPRTSSPNKKSAKRYLAIALICLLPIIFCAYSQQKTGNISPVFCSDTETIISSISAANEKQALKAALNHTLCLKIQQLKNWDIPLNEIPTEVKQNLPLIVKKTKVSEQDMNKHSFKFSITLDIAALRAYVPCYWTTTKISSDDTVEIIRRRQELYQINERIADLFKGLPEKIYLGVRKGMFEISQQDNASTSNSTLQMTYELRFNNAEYAKFEKRLKNLLKKVAIAETSGTGSYEDIHTKWITNSCLRKFNESETSNEWPAGTKTIAFCDEYYEHGKKSYRYQCFAVPKQVYDKIVQLTPTFGTLVFDFTIKGKKETLKRYIQPRLSFFISDSYGDRQTIEFRNWMEAGVPDYKWLNFTSREYKATFSFSEDEIRAMKACTIKVYTGKQAKYICATINNDKNNMKSLAWEYYLPAMLAMAEQFKQTEWYHRAALMGNSYAQKKAAWNNAGLGFDIRVQGTYRSDLFYVESVRKGIPVKRGLALKKINGQNIPARAKDLSQLIGSFTPGTTVSIEFTNGKIIKAVVKSKKLNFLTQEQKYTWE